jgi:hypothetical protein
MQALADHLGYAAHVGVLKPLRALKRLGLVVPIERVVQRGYALTAKGRKRV